MQRVRYPACTPQLRPAAAHTTPTPCARTHPPRYVKWTQEAHPTAGGREQLLKALEAATKALAGAERYYDDPRFLRLWIQYVSGKGGCNVMAAFLNRQHAGRGARRCPTASSA